MTHWDKNLELLIAGMESLVPRFLALHPDKRLCAIGFVFELGNASPQFDACAELCATGAALGPVEDDERWNSGNYAYPAGLRWPAELGTAWEAEVERLHEVAHEGDDQHREVYDGLIRISCEALAVLGVRGVFGNAEEVDFNVSEVNDDWPLVRERDKLIRARMTALKATPKAH